VIAATALVNNLKLATRNMEDYKAVKELEIFNPFK
jgi:predicted nucleic acid-binding protein